jgi:hypothetical protein
MSGCELDGPQHRVPWLGLHDSGHRLGSAVLLSQLCSNHPSGCFLNVSTLKCSVNFLSVCKLHCQLRGFTNIDHPQYVTCSSVSRYFCAKRS